LGFFVSVPLMPFHPCSTAKHPLGLRIKNKS